MTNVRSAPRLLSFHFQAQPKAINCTTLVSTQLILEENAHPFYPKVSRRIARFEPRKLHWNVVCPVSVSKKAAVRSWAANRFRRAFEHELETRGWQTDGTPLPNNTQQTSLSGALRIVLIKADTKLILTADTADIKRDVKTVVDEIVRKQARQGH